MKKSTVQAAGITAIIIVILQILLQIFAPNETYLNTLHEALLSAEVVEKIHDFYKAKEITISKSKVKTIIQQHLLNKQIEKTTENELKTKYQVSRVVDGDTIEVIINEKKEKIRMIGIDTPETKHPKKGKECYGEEAYQKTKSLLEGKKIFLEEDASQGDQDYYKRLLRYVVLEDGSNFNLKMIQEGFAKEYTYKKSYLYQSDFKQAEQEAQKSKKGLWGACSN